MLGGSCGYRRSRLTSTVSTTEATTENTIMSRHPGAPTWVARRLGLCEEGDCRDHTVWRGWTRSDQASHYEQHYRSEVVATLRQVPGIRGARLLRRTIGEETQFVSLTFFDDLDAIRSFAGSDYETAVVAGKAREVLIRFAERVCHYETAFEA